MMDDEDQTIDGAGEDGKDGSGSCSPAGSLSSSLSLSQDFRRQFMKPPSRRKYEETMDELAKQIRSVETDQKSQQSVFQEKTQELRGTKAEREAAIGKRKKIDGELRQLNQEITKKMGALSRVESNLHYKNEAKIDDAIRNMEWQLKTQNFRLAEERKIVAEIDKLKRSKKVLVEYFAQKREVDKIRENQRRLRGERDYYNKAVNNLGKRDEEARKISRESKVKAEQLKADLNTLYEKKRVLFSEFKQSEADFHRQAVQRRNKQRKESFKKREEDRRAKEEAQWKERLKYEAQKEPFEDEKNLCNTLISYLQLKAPGEREEVSLPSPRDEQPEQPIGSTLGPADSLDDGKFVLLKKSEEGEPDYSVSSKRPSRRSRKGRKLSVTKALAHTPQIIAQFSSLNLNAPSNTSEVPASIEQLDARKRYYEEQSGGVPHPLLGSLSGSFSSSGSMSSLDSPLRERSSTWGFVVEVPPAIAEHQTQSDAGTSADTGFHDMSRQASKTESSESATDAVPVSDEIFAEIIAQKQESEFSRSSSDTITPDEHVLEEGGEQGAGQGVELNQVAACPPSEETWKDCTAESSVFENVISKAVMEKLNTIENCRVNANADAKSEMGAKIANYDDDFPPALVSKVAGQICGDVIQDLEDSSGSVCDSSLNSVKDVKQFETREDHRADIRDHRSDIRLSRQGNVWNINQNSLGEASNPAAPVTHIVGNMVEPVCPKIVVSEVSDSLPLNACDSLECRDSVENSHATQTPSIDEERAAKSVICNADEVTHL